MVASLADASADGVDAATLSFLTASALEARKKDEEEEEERKAVETLRSAALSAWQLELNTLVNLGIPSLHLGCLWPRLSSMAVARFWLVFWFRRVPVDRRQA